MQASRRSALILGVSLVAGMPFVPTAWAVVPPAILPQTAETRVSKLIAAIKTADYGSVAAECEPSFRAVARDRFESVAARYGERLKAPCDVVPLGVLEKDGCEVTLWKVKFRNGGDDLLVVLSLADDKIADFSVN